MISNLLLEVSRLPTCAEICGAALAGLAFYLISVAFYRLWLSPISNFPGPKLAALTWAYEFYYDWILPGKYYQRVAEMHKEYGPIVRVTPHELHISDPAYYEKLYVTAAVRRSNTYHDFGKGTGFHDVASLVVDHDAHRGNYVPLTGFFSRAAITRTEDRVTQRLHKLLSRLESYVDKHEVVNFSHAFNSYVNDLLSSIMFEEPSDYLSHPTFNAEWFEKLKQGMFNIPLFAFMPWLASLKSMPVLRLFFCSSPKWTIFDDATQRERLASLLRPDDKEPSRSGTTLFEQIVAAKQDVVTYSAETCCSTAQSFQQSAGHNLYRTLEASVVYLCLDEERQTRLRESLTPLFARNDRPSWVELEKVPYLAACINEIIRLGGGNLRRAARVAPDQDIHYDQWTIPKGTPVGMTIYWMLMDPVVFPNPKSFIPERWLEASPEDLKRMQRYSVGFSRGSRACLGNHLAYAVLYHTVAHLFRPGAPKINLYETDESAAVPVCGLFFTLPPITSSGIKAFLTTETDNVS